MRRTVVVGLLALVAACSGGLDAHAKKACDKVAEVDRSGSLVDGAVGELIAVSEAGKSSEEGLREAAKKTSLDSGANPVDVQFNAVAAWCDKHG